MHEEVENQITMKHTTTQFNAFMSGILCLKEFQKCRILINESRLYDDCDVEKQVFKYKNKSNK